MYNKNMKKILFIMPLMAISFLTNCSKPKDSFTVTWKNWDGEVLEVDENVAKGSLPNYDGKTPTKPHDELYSYYFTKWDHSTKDAIIQDTVFIAQFGHSDLGKLSFRISEDFSSCSVAGIGTYSAKDVTIPSTYEDIPVVAIDSGAFWGGSISSISIPSSITFIGSCAFEDCSNLEYITVDPNNEYFDSRNNCNAIIATKEYEIEHFDVIKADTLIVGSSNTVIPNTVRYIGYGAFSRRQIKTIDIPDGVLSIATCAFQYCEELTSINIPKSVSYISVTGVLDLCSALKTITVDPQNEIFDSRNNCNAIITKKEYTEEFWGTIPKDRLIIGCSNTVIPTSVTSIGYNALEHCTFETIDIPNSVTEICDGAFFNCQSLTSITIPNSVTFMDTWAFGSCPKLSKVDLTKFTDKSSDAIPKISSQQGGPFNGCAETLRFYVASDEMKTAFTTAEGKNWNQYSARFKVAS